MHGLRKFAATVLLVLLIPSIVGLLLLETARSTVLTAAFMKDVVRASGAYEQVPGLIGGMLAAQMGPGASQAPFTSAEIEAMARQVFTSARLQRLIEPALDGFYDWVLGRTPSPRLLVDLRDVQAELPRVIRQAVAAKVAALPICTATQMQGLAARDAGGEAGLPPCRTADDRLNQQIIDQMLPEAEIRRAIPASIDLAQSTGPEFWQDARAVVRWVQMAPSAATWGWAVAAALALLLVVLSRDRWFTPLAWLGVALLVSGLAVAGLTMGSRYVLEYLIMPQIRALSGPALLETLALTIAAGLLATLRNAGLVVGSVGLAAVAMAAVLARHKPEAPAPSVRDAM